MGVARVNPVIWSRNRCGTVSSPEHDRAMMLARNTQGVTSVTDNLKISG